MISKIKQFFSDNLRLDDDAAPASAEQSIRLAAAALLIEVSRADFELHDKERETVIEALQRQFELEPAAVTELVKLAQAEVDESVSLYQFTRLVNDQYSQRQKQQLIGLMWQVAFADGHLDKYEDHLIRKVAELIYVPHSAFIRLKLVAAQGRSENRR